MSNSIVVQMAPRSNRWKLLTTASTAALIAASIPAGGAMAAQADRPVMWIDLGWQYERINTLGDIFEPPFLLTTPRPAFEHQQPLDVEKTLPWAYGADAALSFRPDGSDWIFAASIRYGRSHGLRHTHEQTSVQYARRDAGYIGKFITPSKRFSDATGSNKETHAVVDFQTGKDVGLGLFGEGGASTLSAGVRYVHFKSNSSSLLREDPDLTVTFSPPKYFALQAYHHYTGKADIEREFQGIGPSISWSASAALAGNPEDGEIAIDWGVNAALLFGRQKAKVHHQTSGGYDKQSFKYPVHTTYHTSTNHTRTRNVTVPNIGGFAGLSYRFTDAKLSVGYRADYFFGAMDGGIDARHDINSNFMGPFASISIGLGD